ncbi:acyltransferase family protein [Parafrankia discariae]|uniref:acyltransferase family protein n=1 Tax=Parafrankia discariae TaxID=365528 RepID=UPI0003A724C2|nr:acyltransferase [Parafrankia discariae]
MTLAHAFVAPNSFNALRMGLACTVIIVHGIAFGGYSTRIGPDYDIAAMAVDGFFVISGFLIVRSRIRCRTTARYLWHRAVRILPAFWVCQLVVAFVVAPLGWLYMRGTLAGYLTASPHGPISYVLHNLTPRMSFFDIAGTPSGVPFPPADSGMPALWNGNLWTLWWEVLCYLGVAALAVFSLLRGRVVLTVLGAVLAVLALIRLDPGRTAQLLGPVFESGYGRFAPLFLSGALLSVYAERIPCSRILAAASAVMVGIAYYDPGTALRTISEPSGNYLLGALPMAYLCVWLAIRLPFQGFGTKVDLSYGVYIYGSPVQQLAAVYGLYKMGPFPYVISTLAVTFLLATASWFAVESRALSLRNWTPRTPGAIARAGARVSGRGPAVTRRTQVAVDGLIPRQRPAQPAEITQVLDRVLPAGTTEPVGTAGPAGPAGPQALPSASRRSAGGGGRQESGE